MKLAIMQPYFLPYIGYFQLISAVDVFVIYDNIKYTKKGWINRNRIIQNGRDGVFSLPLKKDSDFLDVIHRRLSNDFDREKLLNQFRGAYSRAPYFRQIFPLLERIVHCKEVNLFHYIHHSVVEICDYLDIATEIRIASEVSADHSLKAEEKVIKLCQALEASTYINAIGGFELYSKENFQKSSIALHFLKSAPFEYSQFENQFIPWLSIIDVLMFNSLSEIKSKVLKNYHLVDRN